MISDNAEVPVHFHFDCMIRWELVSMRVNFVKSSHYYVQHMSFWMDMKCFFGTIVSVIRSDGVVEGGTGTIYSKEKQDSKN